MRLDRSKNLALVRFAVLPSLDNRLLDLVRRAACAASDSLACCVGRLRRQLNGRGKDEASRNRLLRTNIPPCEHTPSFR